MTLATVHARVRRILAKGTSLDELIVDTVRTAARKIEQNRTYQYMKIFGQGTLDTASTLPYVIDLPNQVKRIKLLRLVVNDEYYRIPRGANSEQLSLGEGAPSRYELDGTSRIVFDAVPDQNYAFHIFYDAYTSWPTEDSATNWLIENGEEALVREAVLLLRTDIRDQRMLAVETKLRDEAYRSLLIADEEISETDYISAMTFTPEGGLDGYTATGL